jgi:hypothetical protein
MDEIRNKGPDPRSSAPDSKWIYRIVIAVVLGEAIWSFLASLTNDLLLPAIARVVGGVPFDFKVSNFSASIVELCLAGVVAVVLNSWSRIILRAEKSANRPLVVTSFPPPATPKPILSSAIPTPSKIATAETSAAAAATALKAPAPAPSPIPPPANPPKPARQKQTYYNIVGEPVDADDE